MSDTYWQPNKYLLNKKEYVDIIILRWSYTIAPEIVLPIHTNFLVFVGDQSSCFQDRCGWHYQNIFTSSVLFVAYTFPLCFLNVRHIVFLDLVVYLFTQVVFLYVTLGVICL